jgi:hypothetical protein
MLKLCKFDKQLWNEYSILRYACVLYNIMKDIPAIHEQD